MSYQSEAQLEEQLIKKLESDQGYQFIQIEDYEALIDNFRFQINLFNSDVLSRRELSDKEFIRVMNHLNGKSVYQSAKVLRDQFVLDRDDNTQVYIRFIDETPERNIYQVTSQVTVVGKYKNRYDVTLLCNGLPIVQIELKRAGIDIKEAINQIDRYRIHSYKGLFHYVQIFIISNAVETRYFANTDEKRIMKSLTFYWTDEENKRINNLQEFSISFLAHNRLLKIISRYMVINDTDKNLIVMRPYQIFATEHLVRRALDTDKGGFVFHTTGSGKTLTSWKCANLLVAEPKIKKVFFLVDRKDLDTQTMQEFNKFEDGCVDASTSTHVLMKQVADKNKKLIITTIQKMAKALSHPRYGHILEEYKQEKVIFIIDECHRTQYGEMHTAIRKYFDKAQYFGFTGTPRFRENKSVDGRTTTDIFGKCLHQYMIKEAIFDRNVLGFSVEYISTYEGQYDDKDATLVEDIDRNEILEHEERIAMIANHVVKHHSLKTRSGKYTAIFAISSIPMLIKYYDAFKHINHNYKVAAVFSYGANEDIEDKVEHARDSLERIIVDYNEIYGTAYNTDTFDAYNKDVSKRLKVKKVPQIDILLVVNMYLTGFDSRPLNTLYVDKNLDYHNLLQAFSRTNRVEKDTKPFGNIVCYRNLKKNTDDAIKLFSGGGDTGEVLIKPYEYYIDKFKEKAANLYNVVSSPDDVDNLMSEDDQAKFVIAFRDLSKLILILQTFTDFEWKDIDNIVAQQEYENFKSKYFTIYDKVKGIKDSEKVSILDDIDFNIEIIQTDKINVAYIMNLIKNIDLSDERQKIKDIENIHREIDRTDNPELRKKVDLIKKFLGEIIPNMSPGDSVDETYSEFEDKERTMEIEVFAETHDVEVDNLKRIISEYEFSHILSKDSVRHNLKKELPFLKMTKLLNNVMHFIIENCEKYL
ncbi:MAG: type I restriction endonuclease subunit R [Peptostreptococcaceae bacterium]|nr:type I restriction endonuclease subunit R [Peptostreptococcaceae bacterium]